MKIAGVASDRQWLTLADLISGDRPADALPVYLRAIEPLGSQTGDSVYQQVAALLSKIHATSSWARRRNSSLT